MRTGKCVSHTMFCAVCFVSSSGVRFGVWHTVLCHPIVIVVYDSIACVLLSPCRCCAVGVVRRRPLQPPDVWPLDTDQRATELFNDLHTQQSHAAAGTASPPSDRALLPLLLRTVRRDLLLSAGLMLLYSAAQLGQPLVLRALVQSVQAEDDAGLWLSFVTLALGLLSAVGNHGHMHVVYLIGQRLRSTLIAAVFRRALGQTTADRGDTETGEIINLMALDTQKLYDVMPFVHFFWVAPLQLAVATAVLYNALGPSAFVGVGVIALVAPMTAGFAKVNAKVRRHHMKVSDARIKLCNEALHNMRTVKVFAWESAIMSRILDRRAVEVKHTIR